MILEAILAILTGILVAVLLVVFFVGVVVLTWKLMQIVDDLGWLD
jgi:hypothetical protein